MMRFTVRSVVGVMVAALPCFLSASNTLVDDFTSSPDNQNELDYYWDYYDDNLLQYSIDRPQAAPWTTPSIINVPYKLIPRNLFGDVSDTLHVKRYQFSTGSSGGNSFATMPFTFGEPWEASYCSKGKACAVPYVGITTMLAKQGAGLDLTGATAISFKIRSHVKTLEEVTFRVQTLDIDTYAEKRPEEGQGDEFGYYGYPISVMPGDWQQFSINLSELALPGTWAHEFEFDIRHCTRLTWDVRGYGLTGISDTIDIDDVWILGGTPGYPVTNDPWCRNVQSRPSSGLLSNFETAPREKMSFGTSWYAFDDRDCGGTSRLSEDAGFDSVSRNYQLKWIEKTGFADSGYGAAVVAEFGKGGRKYPLTGDTLNLLSYAGIACNLYDSATATYFDAERGMFGSVANPGPARSIRFDYRTDDSYRLTLEVLDINDVPDRINPNRYESRGAGVVWHHELCSSPGWKSVEIPFDSLHLRTDWAWCVPVPLDRRNLARLRFKVEGKQGMGGVVQIDNVCFPTAVASGAPNLRPSLTAGKPALHALYRNGIIRVTIPAGADYANLTLHVIDPRGRVVASQRMAAVGSDAVINMAGKVPAYGLYFIRLDRGRGPGGNSAHLSAPITLIR